MWSQRYARWKKKAIIHERPEKTTRGKPLSQTFQSGMISRTSETSGTTLLIGKSLGGERPSCIATGPAPALTRVGKVFMYLSPSSLVFFHFHH